MNAIERCRVNPSDLVLLVLPLFHIYAMNVGMNATFSLGAAIVQVSGDAGPDRT